MLETLTSKNGCTNLATCEIKNNEVSARIGALCNVANFVKNTLLINMSDITAYL